MIDTLTSVSARIGPRVWTTAVKSTPLRRTWVEVAVFTFNGREVGRRVALMTFNEPDDVDALAVGLRAAGHPRIAAMFEAAGLSLLASDEAAEAANESSYTTRYEVAT